MRYGFAFPLLMLLVLFLPLIGLEAHEVQMLSYDQLRALIRKAGSSIDFMNLMMRAKFTGFKEERYFGFRFESEEGSQLVLGVMLSKGEGKVIILFVIHENSYPEAYFYSIKGEAILLNYISRSGVVTEIGATEDGLRTCTIGAEPLDAGCVDCSSPGCRPCCSSQISCPTGRYADCKYICSSWDKGCLIQCGLGLACCFSCCSACVKTGYSCICCIYCAMNSGACMSRCCTSSHCACRCLRYH